VRPIDYRQSVSASGVLLLADYTSNVNRRRTPSLIFPPPILRAASRCSGVTTTRITTPSGIWHGL